MPEVLYTEVNGRSEAVWVAADRVLTPAGEIDTHLFSDHEVETLRRLTNLPQKDGCIPLSGLIVDYVNPPARENLFQAAKYAKFVLLGQVTEVKGGFHGTEAGSLLQVVPVEILKSDGRQKRKTYYVFVPTGSFSVGPHRFCAKDVRYPALPEVGDQLILFLPWSDLPSFPLLEIMDEGGVVVLKQDSTVDLPLRYRKDQTIKKMGRGDLLATVRQLISLGGAK